MRCERGQEPLLTAEAHAEASWDFLARRSAAAATGRRTKPRELREGVRAALTYGAWHPPKAHSPCPQAPPRLRELELGFLLLASEGILKDAYLRTTELWMQNGPQESHSPVVLKLFLKNGKAAFSKGFLRGAPTHTADEKTLSGEGRRPKALMGTWGTQ